MAKLIYKFYKKIKNWLKLYLTTINSYTSYKK